MQAEEDYEALGLKSKEGDADAIEEWLSSLCCKFPGEEVALRARFCRQGGRGGP